MFGKEILKLIGIRPSLSFKMKIEAKYYSSYISKKQFQQLSNFNRKIEGTPEDITSKIYLRVLSAKESGSLLVSTNEEKYLFNCGEGIVRISYEYDSLHLRKNKFFGIFITSSQWEKVSGIISLKLNMQESNPQLKMNIFCPKGLLKNLQDSSSLVLAFSKLVLVDSSSVVFQYGSYSEATRIEQGEKNSLMPILKEVFYEKKLRNYDKLPFFTELQEEDDILEPAISIKHVPIYSSNNKYCSMSNVGSHLNPYVLAYICQAKSNIHKSMSTEKLIQCNVPPGPLVTELQSGRDVILSNGSIVQYEDVVITHGDNGVTFIVLDIPSKDYLDSLVSSQCFNPYQNGKSIKEENYPHVIVHFSPVEVMEDERFLKWVKLFHPTVKHMVINEYSRSLTLLKAAAFQETLHHFLPTMFPLPINNEKESSSMTHTYQLPGQTVQALSGLGLSLRPDNFYDKSKCSRSFSNDIPDFMEQIEAFKNKIKGMDKREHLLCGSNKEYPCIHFLGTTSQQFSSYRNESAILVHINQDSCLLLDCGRGTLNQLLNQFGLEGTHNVLKNLKLIYISHYHADHFLGLNSLLFERSKINKSGSMVDLLDPLYIMAIPTVFTYLKVLQNFQPLDTNLYFIDNKFFCYNEKIKKKKLLIGSILSILDLVAIETTIVPHCLKSYGVAFTHKDGWKLVYSGDTLPSTELIKMGKGCDVLIHEATFQDSMEKEAAIKKHCTVSQAIEVAQKMKAKNVILTHFSPRYHKIPLIEGDLPDNTCIAFDNMKVSIEDIPILSKLYPVLKEVFATEYEKLMMKTELKKRRKENYRT